MQEARKGKITDEIKLVAETEGLMSIKLSEAWQKDV